MTNRFAVPGLFVPGPAAARASGWRAVTLPARSAGAWSDSLTVGAALEVTTSLPVVVGPRSLVLDHATDVVAGDLLRVVLADDVALLVEVADVEPDSRGRMIVFDPRQGYLVTRRRPATGATAYRLGDGPPSRCRASRPTSSPVRTLVVVAAAEPVAPGRCASDRIQRRRGGDRPDPGGGAAPRRVPGDPPVHRAVLARRFRATGRLALAWETRAPLRSSPRSSACG